MAARDLADFTAETDGFEAAVLGQRAVDAGDYDTAYFAAEWRDDANRYELDTRRRVELEDRLDWAGKNRVLVYARSTEG